MNAPKTGGATKITPIILRLNGTKRHLLIVSGTMTRIYKERRSEGVTEGWRIKSLTKGLINLKAVLAFIKDLAMTLHHTTVNRLTSASVVTDLRSM